MQRGGRVADQKQLSFTGKQFANVEPRFYKILAVNAEYRSWKT